SRETALRVGARPVARAARSREALRSSLSRPRLRYEECSYLLAREEPVEDSGRPAVRDDRDAARARRDPRCVQFRGHAAAAAAASAVGVPRDLFRDLRSEEHTSELQSLT